MNERPGEVSGELDHFRAAWLLETFGLRGKVALVTGASGGIGSRLAHALARAGATVALNGRSEAKLASLREELASIGEVAHAFPTDLAQPDAPNRLVGEVVDRLGRLDVLVNCAGINRRMSILDVDPASYEEVMTVNLRAPFFLSQAAARVMMGAGGGTIINVGSLTIAIGLQDVSVYGMSKAALAQLTRTMAVEWSRHGIRVNCLAPGFIRTELTETELWGNDHRRRWILERLPIQRAGVPDDLIGALIFLASDASRYVTGQVLWVDGGLLAGSPWDEEEGRPWGRP